MCSGAPLVKRERAHNSELAGHWRKVDLDRKLTGRNAGVYSFQRSLVGYDYGVKTIPRFVATIFGIAVALGLAGAGAATEAQAQPGPFPQWCPGEFWDPGWGNNWDWGSCHDWHGGPGGWDRRPGWDNDHPGGPGWDHDHPGPGGPGWQR